MRVLHRMADRHLDDARAKFDLTRHAAQQTHRAERIERGPASAERIGKPEAVKLKFLRLLRERDQMIAHRHPARGKLTRDRDDTKTHAVCLQ